MGMLSSFTPPLDVLRTHAHAASDYAHVPYSRHPVASAFLLADGQWVPGVRVESASFSLVIPDLLNGYTTLVAGQRTDVVAIAQSEPFRAQDRHLLSLLPFAERLQIAHDVAWVGDATTLPSVTHRWSPFLSQSLPDHPDDRSALATKIAQHAHIPESRFPVGCVLQLDDGRLLPGVNVEFSDWSHILCAERNVLGTALSYGLRQFAHLYLACPRAPGCSPCGACRQLLAELAPTVSVWMGRVTKPLEPTTPTTLLPQSFSGDALTQF